MGVSRDVVVLPAICREEDYRLLRWYFEDYAENDPFQTSRGKEGRELVTSYGRQLIRSLDVDKFDLKNQALRIRVLPGADGNDIFWEALEQREIWPSSHQPSAVTVTRCVEGKSLTPDTETLLQPKDILNILVVIARPQLDRDIPHRFISSTIVKEADLANGRARVEIARPGTFAAFVAT